MDKDLFRLECSINRCTVAYNKAWEGRKKSADAPVGKPTEAHYCALMMAICGYSSRSSIGYWLHGWTYEMVERLNNMARVQEIRDCVLSGVDIPYEYAFMERDVKQ